MRGVAVTSDKVSFARMLRQADNEAQAVLWHHLRDRRLNKFKFVREFAVGPYFLDFACRARRLAVESDGNWHKDREQDRERDAYLNTQGWSVLRFQAGDILSAIDRVLETVVAALDGRLVAGEAPDLIFRPAP